MGLFDDIVPPDIASGGGYRPLRITARPKAVEPPPAPPQLDGLLADIDLVPNQFKPWGTGEGRRGEAAPSPRIAGLFDDIVAPADAGAPSAEISASFGDDDKIADDARARKARPSLAQDDEVVSFGGLLGHAPIIPVNKFSSARFIARRGRIPSPLQALIN